VTVFSLVDGLFLRSVPAKNPKHLVRILASENDGGGYFSIPEFLYLRNQTKTVEDLTADYSTIRHTFNPKLEFNSHVHAMVTAGGLSESSGLWVRLVDYLRSEIMQCWTGAVIELLRMALQSNQPQSDLAKQSPENLLAQQKKRFWRIKIQSFSTIERFLRYVRPICATATHRSKAIRMVARDGVEPPKPAFSRRQT